MHNTISVYDGLRESSSCTSRQGKWCTIQEISNHTSDPFLSIKYKLLDLCKRGTVERKNVDGKPINLFRPIHAIDNSSAQIKVNLPLHIKNQLPSPSSPGTWNFGYDKKTEEFLSAKPGTKIIRGEK